jgi:recombinational DNA repair protein RecR
VQEWASLLANRSWPLAAGGLEQERSGDSRIARGLPIGGDLEFADDATIGRAILNRSSL